jgi:hypothetical protein
MDSMLPQIVVSLINSMAAQNPDIGMITGYLVLVVLPIMSVLIEVLEAAVKLTESKADDEFAAKVKAVWSKVSPILEVLPHINLPLAPAIVKMVELVLSVLGFLKKLMAPKPQDPPAAPPQDPPAAPPAV